MAQSYCQRAFIEIKMMTKGAFSIKQYANIIIFVLIHNSLLLALLMLISMGITTLKLVKHTFYKF
ncbi:MAG TPA: hypothetical protein DCX08_07485 [Porticoccaceae bacterium]|nr:hypothetical protein [Porticoccaceae bacterium]